MAGKQMEAGGCSPQTSAGGGGGGQQLKKDKNNKTVHMRLKKKYILLFNTVGLQYTQLDGIKACRDLSTAVCTVQLPTRPTWGCAE